MAQINKPNEYFNTKLYTGDGTSDNGVTGVGFQPDWTWLKARDSAYNHRLYDNVRGVLKNLQSNSNSAETTANNGLISFDSDGFSVSEGGDAYNTNGQNYVSWNWLGANGTSANTDGGINSTVSVNNTSGFSIVKYGTGTGSATTVGHGMNTAPNFIIIKPLGTIQTGNWIIGGDNLDNTWNNVIELNTTFAKANDPSFNDTAPTSSVFSVGNNNTNRSGENYIAYCFAEKKGFSKFGSYTGNGSADGTFVYTGFKPAMVITKSSSTGGSGYNWRIYDNKRDTFNLVANELQANTNVAEADGGTSGVDFLSNGFKLKTDSGGINQSGVTYIYMCFAEQPLTGTNGVPCTAR